MTYQDLLDQTARPASLLAEPTAASKVFDEIEIQSHWFAGHFGKDHLSNRGERIEIISPGEWNRGAGPDFLRASITIDGVPHQGAIELDLEAASWDTHGHSQSESFDDVILHVVLKDPASAYFTRTSQHREVPRIVLGEAEVQAALGLPRLSQALSRPGRCLTPLAQLEDGQISQLIKEAAIHRATQKALRFEKTANLHSYSQALWESFADALGFSANRFPMRLLAQRLAIKRLQKLPPEDQEAVLFGAAGFLAPTLHESAPEDSQEWLEGLWETWWKHRQDFEFPEDRIPAWSTTGSRPGNHPQRRLAVLVAAARQWRSLVLLSKKGPPFTEFQKALLALENDFWEHHYTLLSDRTDRRMSLIGKARIQEFLCNTLYPLRPEGWNHYQKIRGNTPNQKLIRCSERLFGSLEIAKPFLKFTWQQQGLLQIYQDFCLEDLSDCSACPFPEQLTSWKSHD